MSDLIRRQVAGELFKDVPSARPKRVLQGYHNGAKGQTIRHEELTSIANTRKAVSLTGSLPSARPTGKWILGNGNGQCPYCHHERQIGWDNFCGYCGAEMEVNK